MHYRKKPVVIEAFRLNEDDPAVTKWFWDAIETGVAVRNIDGSWNIKTLEGTHLANADDWIIKGIKGELYPCKPDIFEATYEAVNFDAIEAGAAVTG